MKKGILFLTCVLFVFFVRAGEYRPNYAPSVQPHGRIIFIAGSCSSGKSSMAGLIAQRLDVPYFAFDEYVMPLILKKVIQLHAGKFLAFFVSKFVIRNFFTFVGLLSDQRKYAFQKDFYKQLQNGIAIEPTRKMYHEVRNIALQGRDVVVEAPLHLGDGIDCASSLDEFTGLPVTFVLAYCPWNKLVQRIKERNTSPVKKTHRELDWAIGNFNHCFDLSTIRRDGALEGIRGSEVKKVIAQYADPGMKKERMYLLDETRQATLQRFVTDDMYYVYPRFAYDLVVNTGLYTPQQGADVVMRYLHERGV